MSHSFWFSKFLSLTRTSEKEILNRSCESWLQMYGWMNMQKGINSQAKALVIFHAKILYIKKTPEIITIKSKDEKKT